MSDTSENLGRPVAWQIRDIPESIRDAVTDQARAEKVNVAELLTRLVLDTRDAGWSFTASTKFANTSNMPAPVNLGELAQLIEATRALSETAVVAVPPSIAKDAQSMVKLAIRQAKGLPPPARRKKAQLAIEG